MCSLITDDIIPIVNEKTNKTQIIIDFCSDNRLIMSYIFMILMIELEKSTVYIHLCRRLHTRSVIFGRLLIDCNKSEYKVIKKQVNEKYGFPKFACTGTVSGAST